VPVLPQEPEEVRLPVYPVVLEVEHLVAPEEVRLPDMQVLVLRGEPVPELLAQQALEHLP
jgi:hypothetical protein